MHILYYEQTVYGKGTKWQTFYLEMIDDKMIMAMLTLLFNGRAGDNISNVKKQRQKMVDNGFLRLSCDMPQGTQQTSHSIKEIFIVYLHYDRTSCGGEKLDLQTTAKIFKNRREKNTFL